MSNKEKNSDRLISKEELKKSISSRYNKKVNNDINSEKRRIPLYNNPLYIKTETNQKENINYLTQNENNNIGLTNNQNNSRKHIYYKKNNFVSPQRCNSERDLNIQFLSKVNNTHQAFSTSRNNLRYKNYNRVEEFYNNNNQKISNIDSLNENNNNCIENNIIKQTYNNKNKNKKNIAKGIYSVSNKSFNNKDDKILKSMNLSERNSIQRKSNYTYHYLINNDKIKKTYNEKRNNQNRAIIKKRVNYLPKVKKKIYDEYNEFYIIKLQSVIRGYLLNKRLDKILRFYINIKEAIEIIKRFYKRKIFKIILIFKKKKRYQHQNFFYCKKRNYSKLNNMKDNDNIQLQLKINELINEKKELQTNYKNLKEFMNKFNQLIAEKAEMIQEINKLKQTIKALQNTKELNKINKNKTKYIIQKQNNLNIINKDIINHAKKENKKNQGLNAFLYLDNTKDINKQILNDKNELKQCKMKCLIKNKDNKMKNILNKYFYKFYYLGLINNMNKIENNKPKISVINRRYNVYNNIENHNNFIPHISIKTLSDNSSVFNDAKGKSLSIITGYNMTEEDNKRK